MSVEFLNNVCSKLDLHSVSETARVFETLFAGVKGVQLWKDFRSLELAKPVSGSGLVARKMLLTASQTCVNCSSSGYQFVWGLYGFACNGCYEANIIGARKLSDYHPKVHMCVPHVTLDRSGGGNKMYWRPTVEDVSAEMYHLERQQHLGSAGIFDEYLRKGQERVAFAVYDLYTAVYRREGDKPAPKVVQAGVEDERTPETIYEVLPKDMMMIRSEAIQQKMMHDIDIGCTRNELLRLGVAWTQDADIWQGVFLTDQRWAGIKPRCVAILTEQRAREAVGRARANA
ncbi:hypothetical protein RQP46_007785 [Phenoliferia psychrophenolica]